MSQTKRESNSVALDHMAQSTTVSPAQVQRDEASQIQYLTGIRFHLIVGAYDHVPSSSRFIYR